MKFHLSYLTTFAALGLILAGREAQAQGRATTDVVNIAAAANGGRVLNATSILDDDKEYTASNLIDGENFNPQSGKGSKGWASNRFDPINMESITLGFKGNSLHRIGKIVLNPASAVPAERWAKDVEVQVSQDTAEGPYEPIAQLTLKRAPVAQEFPVFPANARFVRLVFRSNWGSDRAVALGEVEIYDVINDSNPMGQLIVRLESAVTELERYRKLQIESSGGGVAVDTVPSSASASLSPATLQMVQLVTGSETRSFPISRTNVALARNGGKVMAYSSVFDNDPAYGPDKLIDGDNFRMADGKGSFGWSSQGFSPGKEYVTLGFKDDRPKLIGKFVLNPVSNQQDLRWARRVDVQVTMGSFRDGPWRSLTSLNLRPEAVNQDFVIRPVEAKYVRFVFMANGPGIDLPDADPNVNSDRAVSLGEIEIYEAVSTGDQLDAVLGQLRQILFDMKRLNRDPAAQRAMGEAAAETTPARLAPKPAAPAVVKTTPAAAPPKAQPAPAAVKTSPAAAPAKAPPAPAVPRTIQTPKINKDLAPWIQGPPMQQKGTKILKPRRSEARAEDHTPSSST